MTSSLKMMVGAAAAVVLALSASSASAALVVNGDFSAGNSGFTSQYNYAQPNSPNALWPEGTYTVASNPHSVHSLWGSFAAPDGGAMLLVNGAATSGLQVWGQQLSGLKVGDTYDFSFWLASSYATSPAVLDLNVNGGEIGSQAAATTVGSWIKVSSSWVATSTTASLGLVDENTVQLGNDFAITGIGFDDISPVPTGGGGLGGGAGQGGGGGLGGGLGGGGAQGGGGGGPPPSGVPEPATWSMIILGLGLLGGALRTRVRTELSSKPT